MNPQTQPQPQTLEDIRRQAREDWARYRQEALQRTAESAKPAEREHSQPRLQAPLRPRGYGIDDDV